MGITLLASAPGLPTTFPFSLAGAADGICFISGMPSVDTDGSFASGTFEEETERAWRNVVSIADVAGYSVEEILYVQCLFGDIGDYSALNDWWRRQFPDVSTAPARLTFQAGALPFGAKVELQAIAGR
jgi:2-iminobutanoate/2-iminopropanoate deaminase